MKSDKIYLDNCKTSRTDPVVLEAMKPYFLQKYWYPGPFTSYGTEISEDIEKATQIVAESIGAKPEEIVFTSGGTDSNNIGIKGTAYANQDNGKHLITTIVSHPSVLAIFLDLEESGFDVSYISADKDGFIDLEELKNEIREDTTLVAITHINHILGTIQEVKKIREILDSANHKIYLFTDSCEAYTKIPVDVNELGMDLMSVSGHKFNGPPGIGFLYCRKGIKIKPIQHGVARFHKLKPGGINIPSIIGLAKAVEISFSNFDKQYNKYRKLQNRLIYSIVNNIPKVQLNGPRGHKRNPANVNFSFSAVEGEAIMMMLDMQNIIVATGSGCSSQSLEPNYVMLQTGHTHEQANSSIRFTFSRFTTEQDIDKTVLVLTDIIRELRRRSPLWKE
ncbi:MAG: aminotransferase [Candidatus Cloacimonadota bacterium]|nr:MAG: aminotransferase [Candidatus Cloacimonadota bacterium]